MIMRQIEFIILHLMMMTQQMPTILKLRRTHCWRMQPCYHHLRAVSMAPSTLQSKHHAFRPCIKLTGWQGVVPPADGHQI